MKKAIVGIVVAALVLGAVLLLRDGTDEMSRPAGDAPTASAHRGAGKVSSETVLAIAPGMKSAAPSAPVATRVTPLMAEFSKTRSFKSFYERIKAASSPSPEELYALADILNRCAKVAGRKEAGNASRWKAGDPAARDRFAAALSPKVPNRERRIAAFEAANYDRCAGLENIESSEAEIRALLERSAATGEPKARALLLDLDLNAARRGPDGSVDYEKQMAITDEQLETIKQVIASGDPRALMLGIGLLGGNYTNLHVRGPDDSPIDQMQLQYAAALASCGLGRDCGPDHPQLQLGCAMQGHCDAANYRDYLLFYATAPGDSQQVIEYEARLMQAIRQNDWSYFQFFRGPSPGLAPFQQPVT